MPNTGNTRGKQVRKKAISSSKSTASTGRGWHGDPQGHAEAGRAGGEAVSRDRAHMAEIGRKGGEAVSRDRAHMSQIGREGGEARGTGRGASSSSSRGGRK